MLTNFKDFSFKGAAKRLESIDIPRIGSQIGVGEDELHAFMEVEAAGAGFDTQGRPKMLFEPHKFYAHLSGAERDLAVSKGLAYRGWRAGAYPRDSYPRLKQALAINPVAALKSASWGLTQILGENFSMIGYPSVEAMVLAFMDDEEHHLESAVRFMIATGIDDDLRAHRWETVARVYNGPKYHVHGYHTRLAAAFAKWSKIPDTPWHGEAPEGVAESKGEYPVVRLGSRGFVVKHLQTTLQELNYPIGAIDGVFGTTTRGVVLMFQSDNGLPTDGVVGVMTWTALGLGRPRPVGEARQGATVDDLRAKGSETIAQADVLQIGGVAVAGVGALDTATRAVDGLEATSGLAGRVGAALEPFNEALGPLTGFLTNNWQLIALAVGVFVVHQSGVLKRLRVQDHRSGKNGGR